MKTKGIGAIFAIVIVIIIAAAAAGAYFVTRDEEEVEEEGPVALGITTTSLSDGVVGVAYSATLVASGGTSPYTWENIGSLPDGLSLSTSGIISGTPTTEGDFSFTVKVTDSVENTDTKALSIHVAALGITTTSLSGGTVDAAYSATLAAIGGTSPYTWSIESGSLPAGLTLSTGGVISGTPTTAGDSSFTVKVTDSVENTDTKALSIHVAAAGAGGAIATAESLSFKIDYTVSGTTYTYQFRGRNLTGNADLRVDYTIAGTTTVSYILNSSTHSACYGWEGGYWLSADYDTYWADYYVDDYTLYTGWLADWVSGEYEYSYGGYTYRLYAIEVNPTLGSEIFTCP